MKIETALIILAALGVMALLILGFFAVFRGKGKFSVETKLGKASAEGENPLPPGKVAGGVTIEDARAGGSVHGRSTAEGGVGMKRVEAGTGDVTGEHHPGGSPPKP